jgi:hypothetical protein
MNSATIQRLESLKGQTLKVTHPTGVVETGKVIAVRTYGWDQGWPVQVEMIWPGNVRCWVAANTALDAEVLPGKAHCDRCDQPANPANFKDLCDACDAARKQAVLEARAMFRA